MARSNPERSEYCATRHLLRRLGNVRELQRNPLVREAFATHDAETACRLVESRAHAAIASMRSARWRAILLLADVQKHPPARVARDLGLSARQYHRERCSAHAAFASAYSALRRPLPVTVDDDAGRRKLQLASALADSGIAQSARSVLEEAAAAGGQTRCDALVRLAILETWASRFEAARCFLRAADDALALTDTPPQVRSNLVDARLAAALALAAFSDGPERLRHSATAGIESAFAHADAAFVTGDPTPAQSVLECIGRSAPSPATAIDALIMQGELANFTCLDGPPSVDSFGKAVALAEFSGMLGRRLYAQSHLLLSRWMYSRRASDRAAYRALIDGVDPALPARLRMCVASSAADVELAIGSPQRAATLARRTLSLSHSTYDRLSARALLADSLLRLGQVEEAVHHADVTAEGARSARYPRILSLVQRVNAQAAMAGGNLRIANDAIEESLDCARASSSLYVRQTTESVRARIRHIAAARHGGRRRYHTVPT